MTAEVVFTRKLSVAELIVERIAKTTASLDAALYRFNSPKLAEAFTEAARRGVSIRLVLDRRKYEEDALTRRLMKTGVIPFRLSRGRKGNHSKMHHKFAILDGRTVTTGSYNWTLESEEDNYENMVVLHGTQEIEDYRKEFELLWEAGDIKA